MRPGIIPRSGFQPQRMRPCIRRMRAAGICLVAALAAEPCRSAGLFICSLCTVHGARRSAESLLIPRKHRAI